MRLFQDPHAPNPRRVRIFMAEKQLGARGVSVDLVEVRHWWISPIMR